MIRLLKRPSLIPRRCLGGASLDFLASESSSDAPPSDRLSFLYTAQTKVPFTVEPNLDFRATFDDLARLSDQLTNRADWYAEKFLRNDRIVSMRDEYLNGFVPLYKKFMALRQSASAAPRPTASGIVAEMGGVKRQLETYRPLILDCLDLPNSLHQQLVPLGHLDEHTNEEQPTTRPLIGHHKFLAQRQMILQRSDPERLFLQGPAVDFVRRAGQCLTRKFHQLDFTACSPPHFVRSAVLEAFGLDFRQSESRKLAPSVEKSTGDDLSSDMADFVTPHLVGNGPLPYFATFTGKTFSPSTAMPLKFYSLATTYHQQTQIIAQPQPSSIRRPLLDHFQRPTLALFILAPGRTAVERAADDLSATLDSILRQNFRLHASQSLVASKNLSAVEHWRRNFSVAGSEGDCGGAPILLSYVADFGDFVSRKLRICAGDQALHAVYAQVDIFGLLAAVIERNFTFDDESDVAWKLAEQSLDIEEIP